MNYKTCSRRWTAYPNWLAGWLWQRLELGIQTNLIIYNQLTWAAFGKLGRIFNSNVSNTLKGRTFDQCVLPVLIYGTESKCGNYKNKPQIVQPAMKRRTLGIRLKDKIRNIEITKSTKVTDKVNRARTFNWTWAGHIARTRDNRWIRPITELRPWYQRRPRVRPQTRWSDDIKIRTGHNWIDRAQNKER